MIMWIPHLISCGIHMKSEILSDHAAPRAGAASQYAHGSQNHHAPLKSTALSGDGWANWMSCPRSLRSSAARPPRTHRTSGIEAGPAGSAPRRRARSLRIRGSGQDEAAGGDAGAGGYQDGAVAWHLVDGRAADLADRLGYPVHAVDVSLPELAAVCVERQGGRP